MNEDKRKMPTKVELTLEQSQQGVSDDVLSQPQTALRLLESLGAWAILVNLWNITEVASSIAYALNMHAEERENRHHHNFLHVTTHTSHAVTKPGYCKAVAMEEEEEMNVRCYLGLPGAVKEEGEMKKKTVKLVKNIRKN
ncbi:alpha,alpha-trehalose-phosphate synthase [UDP-forming] 1-like protein, partial [Tanacetum coccineum]